MRACAVLFLMVVAPPVSAAGPSQLFREIRTAHEDYDLPKYYALSRRFLKVYPRHRAADRVRYDMAAQLIAENLQTPESAEGREARALLRAGAANGRSKNARFDAALLSMKYEPTDDPGKAAAQLVKQFPDHPDVEQAHLWAVAELEKRGRLEGAARWARLLLQRNPRSPMAERCQRLIRRSELIGQPAPFTPSEQRIVDGLGGRILLVDFWATWCAPCVQTMPRLVALHRRLGPRGLRIVGIDMDDTPEASAKIIAEHGVSWPMIKSGFETDVDERFGIQELPSYVIVDLASGRILDTDLSGDALFARLETLLP